MVEKQRDVKFGELGFITHARTYARETKAGAKETFSETVERELLGIDKQLKLKQWFLTIKGYNPMLAKV